MADQRFAQGKSNPGFQLSTNIVQGIDWALPEIEFNNSTDEVVSG